MVVSTRIAESDVSVSHSAGTEDLKALTKHVVEEDNKQDVDVTLIERKHPEAMPPEFSIQAPGVQENGLSENLPDVLELIPGRGFLSGGSSSTCTSMSAIPHQVTKADLMRSRALHQVDNKFIPAVSADIILIFDQVRPLC